MPRTREQIEKAAADAEAWLDQLDPDDPNVTVDDMTDLRDIAAAVAAREGVERQLEAAVAKAHDNGRSWNQIARILGMSRQAAQKRFDVPSPTR